MAGSSNTLAPLRWRSLDGLHVSFVEAEVPVSEELWDRCMVSRSSPEVSGCLSIIGGDGFAQISRRQWRVSATIAIRRRFPFAMISSHRITLAMVCAAEWSGANIRAFKWAELDLAFAFLGVAPERYAAVRELAEQLRHAGDPERKPAHALDQSHDQGSGDIWQESPE